MSTKCPSRLGTVVFWTAASLALLTGCPDPDGTYEEFLTNTADKRGGTVPVIGEGIKDIGGGTFLLTIRANMAKGNPLLFRATTTALRPTEDGGALVDLAIEPLVAQFGGPTCGEARTPAPAHPDDTDGSATITAENVAIAPDGTFTIDFGEQLVHGCANAISFADIKAKLVLHGATVSVDCFGGTMDGALILPYAAGLPGEFAFLRIDGEVPSEEELPATSVCPGETGEGGSGGGGGEGGSGGSGGDGA
jgi:hypothetical protein